MISTSGLVISPAADSLETSIVGLITSSGTEIAEPSGVVPMTLVVSDPPTLSGVPIAASLTSESPGTSRVGISGGDSSMESGGGLTASPCGGVLNSVDIGTVTKFDAGFKVSSSDRSLTAEVFESAAPIAPEPVLSWEFRLAVCSGPDPILVPVAESVDWPSGSPRTASGEGVGETSVFTTGESSARLGGLVTSVVGGMLTLVLPIPAEAHRPSNDSVNFSPSSWF